MDGWKCLKRDGWMIGMRKDRWMCIRMDGYIDTFWGHFEFCDSNKSDVSVFVPLFQSQHFTTVWGPPYLIFTAMYLQFLWPFPIYFSTDWSNFERLEILMRFSNFKILTRFPNFSFSMWLADFNISMRFARQFWSFDMLAKFHQDFTFQNLNKIPNFEIATRVQISKCWCAPQTSKSWRDFQTLKFWHDFQISNVWCIFYFQWHNCEKKTFGNNNICNPHSPSSPFATNP